VFGVVSIPGSNVIWSVVRLMIFGGFTIFDFNRFVARGRKQRRADRSKHLSGHPDRVPQFLLLLFVGERDSAPKRATTVIAAWC
jgi:hypothetical protein